MIPTLDTERLRALTVADFPDYASAMAAPDVMRSFSGAPDGGP